MRIMNARHATHQKRRNFMCARYLNSETYRCQNTEKCYATFRLILSYLIVVASRSIIKCPTERSNK